MKNVTGLLTLLALPACMYANQISENFTDSARNALTQFSIASTSLNDIQTLLLKNKDTLNPDVINTVLTTIKCVKKTNHEFNNILTIIDYSLPSNQKRLWIFDLKAQKLLFYTYVSHGIKSGSLFTEFFSNKVGSQATSLGVFSTQQTYTGRHGYTLKLNGLENNINDNADRRSIVMHPAWYVDKNFSDKYGRIGRSWGCPAVPSPLAKEIIDTIKNQSLFVIYYPSKEWIAKSRYLNCESGALQTEINNLKIVPETAINDQRGEILYTDTNHDNKRTENESILVVTADSYIKTFNTKAPLERMLRRQINGLEYIAINLAELKLLQEKQSLALIEFVIPEVKMRRGYFATEFKFVDFGKVSTINCDNSPCSFSSTKGTIELKTTDQFIRWLGL